MAEWLRKGRVKGPSTSGSHSALPDSSLSVLPAVSRCTSLLASCLPDAGRAMRRKIGQMAKRPRKGRVKTSKGPSTSEFHSALPRSSLSASPVVFRCMSLLVSCLPGADVGEEDEERADGPEAEEGEGEEGQGPTALLRSESSLDAASFWDNLLQETWQRLQREEEAAMAAAGPPALAGRRTSRDHGGLGTPGQLGGNHLLRLSSAIDARFRRDWVLSCFAMPLVWMRHWPMR